MNNPTRTRRLDGGFKAPVQPEDPIELYFECPALLVTELEEIGDLLADFDTNEGFHHD